ncbi:MAG TPA: ornithine cyclodeaminase family protein [Thermoanaerobaculia bacterium]|jgi:ornithine cyclodeaminase|nr:ornithine cyclodeaminase family protein [Thermoanaerobaculia bacterium]
MSFLFLNREDVESLLPMADCIEVVAEALRVLARGDAVQPLRSALWMPDRHGLLVVMPGMLGRAEDGVAGAKVLTVVPDNFTRGEDSHQGLVLLFDQKGGRPLALLDAGAVTAIRTAAASAVATRALAREDAGDLAILGTGVQARSHLEAMRAVRTLRRVRVWSRNFENARRLAAEEGARLGFAVEPVSTAREAVAGADLICTVTAATAPVLLGEWISPGAHVNAVGACTPNARELDAAAVARARLFTDRKESLFAEAGDFLLARAEGAVDDSHCQGELGDVLEAKVPGRRSEDEVILFKSLGIAVEDLAAGRFIYAKALGVGKGTKLEL